MGSKRSPNNAAARATVPCTCSMEDTHSRQRVAGGGVRSPARGHVGVVTFRTRVSIPSSGRASTVNPGITVGRSAWGRCWSRRRTGRQTIDPSNLIVGTPPVVTVLDRRTAQRPLWSRRKQRRERACHDRQSGGEHDASHQSIPAKFRRRFPRRPRRRQLGRELIRSADHFDTAPQRTKYLGARECCLRHARCTCPEARASASSVAAHRRFYRT